MKGPQIFKNIFYNVYRFEICIRENSNPIGALCEERDDSSRVLDIIVYHPKGL